MENVFFFSSTVPRRAQRKLQFYDAPVILNDVACTGSETNITQCTRAGYRSVTDCTDIAVAHCEGIRSVHITAYAIYLATDLATLNNYF